MKKTQSWVQREISPMEVKYWYQDIRSLLHGVFLCSLAIVILLFFILINL